MFKKKLLLFSLFFIVFGFCLLVNNQSKVYAVADSEGFTSFVEDNAKELHDIFLNYDYLVVNHYSNYFIVYYTNCANNKFFIDNDIYGKGHTVISSTSDLGNNLFDRFFFNPNNDSNFRLPTNLKTSFTEYDFENDRNYVISGYSLDKVFYSSEAFISFNEVIDTKKAFPPWTTIAKAVQEVEMKVTLQEIITILTLILVLVVSFLGLRKGLKVLLTLLRAS